QPFEHTQSLWPLTGPEETIHSLSDLYQAIGRLTKPLQHKIDKGPDSCGHVPVLRIRYRKLSGPSSIRLEHLHQFATSHCRPDNEVIGLKQSSAGIAPTDAAKGIVV